MDSTFSDAILEVISGGNVFRTVASPSVLWYCWLGLLTCKNRLKYNLYCVGGDVKPCSLTHFRTVGYPQCQLRQRFVPQCNWWRTKNPSLGSDIKQESMHWKHANSPPPRKFRTRLSAGKVMATIFLDCKGVLLLDYLPHKTTITGPDYSELLKKTARHLQRIGGECWPDVHCHCTTMHRRTCLKLHEPYSQGHRSWTAVSSTVLNRPGT